MTPGVFDVRIVTRHLAALREALGVLSKHSETPIENLDADSEERWAVERGLRPNNLNHPAAHRQSITDDDVAGDLKLARSVPTKTQKPAILWGRLGCLAGRRDCCHTYQGMISPIGCQKVPVVPSVNSSIRAISPAADSGDLITDFRTTFPFLAHVASDARRRQAASGGP